MFRIELQQQRSSGNLVLYHFVGHSSSRSACPIVMIRRITEKVRVVDLLVMLRNPSLKPVIAVLENVHILGR